MPEHVADHQQVTGVLVELGPGAVPQLMHGGPDPEITQRPVAELGDPPRAIGTRLAVLAEEAVPGGREARGPDLGDHEIVQRDDPLAHALRRLGR